MNWGLTNWIPRMVIKKRDRTAKTERGYTKSSKQAGEDQVPSTMSLHKVTVRGAVATLQQLLVIPKDPAKREKCGVMYSINCDSEMEGKESKPSSISSLEVA